MPTRGNGKSRSTRTSQRIKNLEEQDVLYKQILSQSLVENMASSSIASQSLEEKTKGENTNAGANSVAHEQSSTSTAPVEGTSDKKGGDVEKSPKHKRTHEVSDSDKDNTEVSPSKVFRPSSPSGRVILKPKKGSKTKQKPSASISVPPDRQGAGFDMNQAQFGFPQQGMFNYQNQFPMQQYQDPRSNWWWQNQMPMNFNSNLNSQFINPLNSGNQQTVGSEEDSDSDSDEEEIQVLTSSKAEESSAIKTNTSASKEGEVSKDAAKSGRLGEACSQESNVKTNEKDKVLGPPADETLVAMLKNFLERSRKQASVDELLVEFPRPSNMPFLNSPKIEEDLFPKLAQHIKNFDRACRWLQKYISGAITALIRAIDTLIAKEKKAPDEELYQAGLKIQGALKLLAFSHTELNHRRKDALRNTVNADCLPLLKHNRPSSDDWLLGQNLSDTIKEIEDSKKISDRILKSAKPTSTFQQGGNKTAQQKGKRFRYKKHNKGGHQSQGFRLSNPSNQGFYQAQTPPFPGMVAPVQLQGPRFPNPAYQAMQFQPQNMGGNSGWRQQGQDTRFQQKRKH